MELRSISETQPELSLSHRIEHMIKPLSRIIEIQELYKNKSSQNRDFGQEAASEVVLLNAQKIHGLIEEILDSEKEKLRIKMEPLIFFILKEAEEEHRIYQKMSQSDILWLKEIEEYVLGHLTSPELNLRQIAYTVAISERQFHRRINKLLTLTPNKFINRLRMHKAKELLENRTYSTVQEVAREVGFLDTHYFVKAYQKMYGIRPKEVFNNV